MSDIWFTSDTHFGHQKILEFEPEARPFRTIEEHDEELIRRWNRWIKPIDIVWHLGDFSLGGEAVYYNTIRRLNGRKRIVLGNHDTNVARMLPHFDKLVGAQLMPFDVGRGKRTALLTHVPAHPASLAGRAELNLHGHLHSRQILGGPRPGGRDVRYLNCAVEHWSLYPIHYDEVVVRFRQLDQERLG